MSEVYFCSMNLDLSASWKQLLEDEMSQPYFIQLIEFVKNQYAQKPNQIFPPKEWIFRALNSVKLTDVKVVIIGQDPYPTKGHANGLCFSLQPDVQPLAKSLVNIFKEIESDLGIPFPENGDLSRWADQGVLLLNSILTVEEGKPLSHQKKGWEQFTDAIIQHIVESREGIVFVLWGSTAIAKLKECDLTKHHVLTSVHPSPLSAYRGFFGCKHFSTINKLLISSGKTPIQW